MRALVTDVQGDWRSATRLYGSRLRAGARPACRRRRARRAATGRRGAHDLALHERESCASSGSSPRRASRPSSTCARSPSASPSSRRRAPVALFVGVLEPYKNIDGLADAWRLVAARLPDARLHIVGKGSREEVVRALLRDCPGACAGRPCSMRTACRARARRGDAARPAVPLGGDGPGGDRGVLSRPPGHRVARRRHSRPRRGRAQRSARRAGRHRCARRSARGSACATRPSLGGSAGQRAPSAQAWLQTPQEFASRTRAARRAPGRATAIAVTGRARSRRARCSSGPAGTRTGAARSASRSSRAASRGSAGAGCPASPRRAPAPPRAPLLAPGAPVSWTPDRAAELVESGPTAQAGSPARSWGTVKPSTSSRRADVARRSARSSPRRSRTASSAATGRQQQVDLGEDPPKAGPQPLALGARPRGSRPARPRSRARASAARRRRTRSRAPGRGRPGAWVKSASARWMTM